MTRNEQRGEPMRRLGGEPGSERRRGRTRGSCPPRSFSTWLLPLAIAALALAPAPARAQRGVTVLGNGALTAVTVPPAAPIVTAPPTAGFTATVSGILPSGLADAVLVAQPAGVTCSAATLNAVRGTGSEEVTVACKLTLTLEPNQTITRKIALFGASASGSTIQCKCDTAGKCATLSGNISIGGSEDDGRPENITVRNCTIKGNVRLEIPDTCPQARFQCRFQPALPFNTCLPSNVPPPTSCDSDNDCPCGHVCELDRTSCADTHPGFAEWLHARAPRRTTFDHVTIAGTGKDRFYVGWGATETKLINSVITGDATGVPIYLGPHSSGTVIKNNWFDIATTNHDREVIAIDGSDHNQIISNWFAGTLNHGGIYLFRNCGEKGTIRHTTPSYNQIVNNVFPYNKYDGPNPAVYLGSRNGNPPGFEIGDWGSYCNDDEGFPYGSSADDRDFATHNVVMQNEIFKRPVTDVVRSTNWVNNSMNLIDRNRTVTQAAWPRPPAGCYVRGGYKEFIAHGETTEKFADDDGEPACGKVTCHDGELRPALLTASFDAAPSGLVTMRSTTPVRDTSACNVRRVPINCQVNGDNAGCHQTVYCPAGTTIVGAVAACNLEYGAVSDGELSTVPPNLIHVAKNSDHIEDGSCYVGNNTVVGEIAGLLTGPWIPDSAVQTPIRGIFGLTRVPVGCDEQDNNGGDCHIRGSLYCR